MIDINDFVDGWYFIEEDYTHNHTILLKQMCIFIKKRFISGPNLYLISSSESLLCILSTREFKNNVCPIIRKLTADELMIKDIIE